MQPQVYWANAQQGFVKPDAMAFEDDVCPNRKIEMKNSLVLAALIAAAALAACGKKEEPAPAPAPAPVVVEVPAPAPAPMPAAEPAAAVSDAVAAPAADAAADALESWLKDPFSRKAPYRKVGAFFWRAVLASALSHLYPGSSLERAGHSDLFGGPVQRQ